MSPPPSPPPTHPPTLPWCPSSSSFSSATVALLNEYTCMQGRHRTNCHAGRGSNQILLRQTRRGDCFSSVHPFLSPSLRPSHGSASLAEIKSRLVGGRKGGRQCPANTPLPHRHHTIKQQQPSGLHPQLLYLHPPLCPFSIAPLSSDASSLPAEMKEEEP